MTWELILALTTVVICFAVMLLVAYLGTRNLTDEDREYYRRAQEENIKRGGGTGGW